MYPSYNISEYEIYQFTFFTNVCLLYVHIFPSEYIREEKNFDQLHCEVSK